TQREELSSFANEDSQDRTRIAQAHFEDEEVGVEADAAFAAIGADVVAEDEPATSIIQQEELAEAPPAAPTDPHALESPFDEPPEPRQPAPHGMVSMPGPLPDVEPTPLPAKSPSVDLDLG